VRIFLKSVFGITPPFGHVGNLNKLLRKKFSPIKMIINRQKEKKKSQKKFNKSCTSEKVLLPLISL
jgi:hypothetical protein